MYFDKEGSPIDLWSWAALMEHDEYRILKHTYFGPYWVSTVWLGLDHNIFGGPPLIFETMVFDIYSTHPLHDLDQERYSTERQAIEGHNQTVWKWREGWINTRGLKR